MPDRVKEKLVELIVDAIPPCYSDVFATQIADHLIANGVTLDKDEREISSRWIPASEPPKEPGEYNVHIKGTEVATTLFYSIISKNWYEFSDDEHEHPYEITHWMPLPQPPKGE